MYLVINIYQIDDAFNEPSVSGQLINLHKSEISFGRNVPDDRKILFQG